MKTILVDAVQTFVIEGEGINQEMYAMLEEYDNPKIIVTNANDEQILAYSLDDMPYDVFTLKHEPDKTDPQYFVTLLETFDLEAEDVLYFEHTPGAVRAAQSVGIVSQWYDPDAQDIEEIRMFIDENL